MRTIAIITALLALGLVGCTEEEHYEEYPDDPNETTEQVVGDVAEDRAEATAPGGPLNEELQGEQAEIRAELRHEVADDEGVVEE